MRSFFWTKRRDCQIEGVNQVNSLGDPSIPLPLAAGLASKQTANSASLTGDIKFPFDYLEKLGAAMEIGGSTYVS